MSFVHLIPEMVFELIPSKSKCVTEPIFYRLRPAFHPPDSSVGAKVREEGKEKKLRHSCWWFRDKLNMSLYLSP